MSSRPTLRMTKALPIIAAFFLFSSTIVAPKPPPFSRSSSPTAAGLKKAKLTHLHFYFHDIVSGPNPTAVRVAAGSRESKTSFGDVVVIDDPLTAGPTRKSKVVGRAQGIYCFASQSEVALLMAVDFVFFEGKLNGSSLSLLGRNAVVSEAREMPIVGGSGVFRLSKGYAKAKTFRDAYGEAIVKYNVYVFHYDKD